MRGQSLAALGDEQKEDVGRNSQRGDVESVAKNTDEQLQLKMRPQQQASRSRSVPHRRTVSSGSIPPFFIWGIHPSTFPCCLPTLSASLLGLKLCKSSTFPSSPAAFPLCFSTGFASIPGGSLQRRLKDFVFVLLSLRARDKNT